MTQILLAINTFMSAAALVCVIGVIWYLIIKRGSGEPKEKEIANPVRFEGQPIEQFVVPEGKVNKKTQHVEINGEPTEKEIMEAVEPAPLSNTDKILKCLDGKPKMPVQIAEETGIKRQYVSGYLSKMLHRKLVRRNAKGWVRVYAKSN